MTDTDYKRRFTTSLTALLVATAALSACGADAEGPDDGSTTASTATSAFDLTNGSNSESPEEDAKQAALTKAEEFNRVRWQLEVEPGASLDALDSVAADPLLNFVRGDINVRRTQGVTTTGSAAVVEPTVTDQGVPVDADGKAIPGPAWVHVRACIDVSGISATKPDGSSAIAANRPPRLLSEYTVRNAAWPDSSGWRVTSDSTTSLTPC